MEVGILFKGNSLVEPITGIELKRCITYKQLAKYKIRLLENVKKDDIEQIKQLPKEGSTYSIGACDVAVKNITLYIKDLNDIINEKDTVLKEKEKSIKILRDTTEKNVELEKTIEQNESNISDLRNQIKDLTLLKDKNESEINELKRQLKAITDKLTAETNLRIEVQSRLDEYKESLGSAIEETENKFQDEKNNIQNKYDAEIDRIKEIIKSKEDIIIQKDQEIDNLEKINEELGKSGSIPDIPFTYKGKASIIGVCSKGSYGVSSLAYTIAKLINEQKKILLVDLDFKGGTIGKYVKSENKVIENMLKGGPLLVEHIISNKDKLFDFIGGVENQFTPYEILNLDWESIFSSDSNYDYIICDCGMYGGYNIQSKICEFIASLGKMIYLYIDDETKSNKFIDIKTFTETYEGIPFISKIIVNRVSLYDEPITYNYIKNTILNKVI